MRVVEEKVNSLSNLDDIVKVSRDMTSMKADIRRMESRSLKSIEEYGNVKSEVDQLSE